MDFNTCRRSLEYKFQDSELKEMSQQLAVETQNKRRLEESKKAVNSQYGAQINEKSESINLLSDKISSGYEYRDIECTVEWHTPVKNKKTVTRNDTGESWTEGMTEYDHNLFTQWQDEQLQLAEENDEEEAVTDDVIIEEDPVEEESKTF